MVNQMFGNVKSELPDLSVLSADLEFIISEAKQLRSEQRCPIEQKCNIMLRCIIRLAESQQAIIEHLAQHPTSRPRLAGQYTGDSHD